ncbi:Glycosyltransferase involved in cell wall bisynthesis [Halanaerobium congolense]|uniref:Glycosyltransferase involved in cell wall bisynthesis n=1 Tax=Halanaerobium congolense TaxID=54121 RepID=A0A1I0AKF5_9FIRM|nr:glycosyltransferase [Halanaerobium congolense]PTX16248.1 glycosyltransferase involved in cell wall biosynthesis [Halanaerobium congolense]SDF46646.1 Glycosyltransferase involved in cell wall bisynthesis [Halanaerobium congolense]SES94786.1 Glycosyltransferase involved in cell wall bisynthesis [Halanaerobium congolense]SFP27325.1 Glycosyltransferase involved in cell wall bisynthesis [Halanaerobium congolense]
MTNNILFINTGVIWGGVEGWNYKTAKALDKRGYNIFILAKSETPFSKKCKKANLQVNTIKEINSSSFFNLFRVNKLKKYLIKNKIDVMFFCQSSHFKFASLAGYLANVDRIIYRRALAKPINNHFYNRLALENFVTDFMAISKTTLNKSLEKLPENVVSKEKIKLIYNGVNSKKFVNPKIKNNIRKQYNIDQDDILIANIGRLGRQKAQQDLINAINELNKNYKKFKVLFVGTGDKAQEYKNLVKELNLEDKIIFTGFREDVPSILKQVDFVAHSAIYEGCPWIVLETMAAAKPIVAVDIPSVRELVIDGETGILSERNTTKFANTLLKMIQNKEKEKMGEYAQKIYKKNYTFNKMIDNIEKRILY